MGSSPICNNKTRIKVRPDTVLENFPLFCPKCKRETIISVTGQNVVAVNKLRSIKRTTISVKQFHTSVITEPDAKTQSRTASRGSYFHSWEWLLFSFAYEQKGINSHNETKREKPIQAQLYYSW